MFAEQEERGRPCWLQTIKTDYSIKTKPLSHILEESLLFSPSSCILFPYPSKHNLFSMHKPTNSKQDALGPDFWNCITEITCSF